MGQEQMNDESEIPNTEDQGLLARYFRHLLVGSLILIVMIAVIGFALRDGDSEGLEADIAAAAEEEGSDVRVECVPREYCEVAYDISSPPGSAEEVLDRQRYVWEEIWSEPDLERATITLEAETDGADADAILAVECDRFGGRAIEWANATPELVNALCDWNEIQPNS